jgi:hypothetical protein
MATVRVHAPVKDFEGEVAGVRFEEGVAEVERGSAAYQYFRGAGYGIDRSAEVARPEPPDPRDLGTDGDGVEVVGTRLRDAAVDPQPGDFLPPTNAGVENPHGSLVVSPGLHASAPGPIAPGAVSSDPGTQQAKETALAEAVFVEQQPVQQATADVPDDVPQGTEDAADPKPQDDDTVPDDDYDVMSLAALRDEASARELAASGTKADLKARLRADDAVNARPADTEGADGTEHS